MGIAIIFPPRRVRGHDSSVAQRRGRSNSGSIRGRIKRPISAMILLAIPLCCCCFILSVGIMGVSSKQSYSVRPTHRHQFLPSSPSSTSSIRSTDDARSAFIFSLLRKQRSDDDSVVSGSEEQQPEPSAVPHYLADTKNGVNGDRLNHGTNNLIMNSDIDFSHQGYILEKKEQLHQSQNQLISGMDIVEDEPYFDKATATGSTNSDAQDVNPIMNAYNALSKFATPEEEMELSLSESDGKYESLDSTEGNDDNVTFVRVPFNGKSVTKEAGIDTSSNEAEEKNEEQPYAVSSNVSEEVTTPARDKETATSEDTAIDNGASLWDKRNARSIDEGIRFKSQLRDGLENQSKLHREQLLSNLLDGVVGGTTSALENLDAPEKIKNVTSRFRLWGFGRGNKQDKDRVSLGEEQLEKGGGRKDNVYEETHDFNAAFHPDPAADKKIVANNKFNNLGARTIAGLISALAEEVEDLEVLVDSDPNTPKREKVVNSIKIYFSRLGFRQLYMNGVEADNELENSVSIRDRFALARSFFNLGEGWQPTTADEAFDSIDVDKSGALDEEELAQALKLAALIGGDNMSDRRSDETLTELASSLVKLYDADGNGVVDREEYQAMVADMAALRKTEEQDGVEGEHNGEKKGWFSWFRGKKGEDVSVSSSSSSVNSTTTIDEENVIDVSENEELWAAVDRGEGSLILEDLKLDLRQVMFGALPGVKRVLPGGPLFLKPVTATLTCSFNADDIMNSILLDTGLRRLVARALSRRVRGIRDLLDGAIFYGRTWKLFEQNSPLVEVAKLEDVYFDKRDRLVITGRAKITEVLGVKHEPIEQRFRLRTKIGTRANGRIIGLLQPEIAIFAECPKDLEEAVRTKCKEWFDYTIPQLQPVYTYIPLVSPLKKDDKMDGFNMGEDNQIKSIDIKSGKLRLSFCAFLRPGRFLGNHYLAFTVPNRTLILTVDRVREGMRGARRNKRLAQLELAAREDQQKSNNKDGNNESQFDSAKPLSISPEGKVRIRQLEKELQTPIREEVILRQMEDRINADNDENPPGKSFIGRFVEGYSGAIRQELDLEMYARLSTSISHFFGSQDQEDANEDDETKERM